MPNQANRGITRVDTTSGTHGWQVRIQRRGQIYSRFFADKAHGDAQIALKFALSFRDDLLAKLTAPPKDSAPTRSPSRRNTSGVVGVSQVTVIRGNQTYTFWQATWSPERGKRSRVKFSILRYGNRRAFQLACAARKKAVGGS